MSAPSPPASDKPRFVLALDERHPSWARLESPYRQPNKPVSFRNVHLSDWLALP